jgi:hypothetical protein
VRGPVERAETRARGHRGVGRPEQAGADAAGDERADAALVAVAFGDDAGAQPRRQGVDLEMRGRSLDIVEQHEHVGDGQGAQARRQRPAVAAGDGQGGEQPVERAVLAEEEQFVLAGEVVIQVAGREVGGDGDVAHPGGSEAAGPEHARRGAHDRDAAGFGAA